MTDQAKADFVETQARILASRDDAHEAAAPEIGSRLEELLENPDQRDTGIIAGMAGYLYLGQVNAGENPDEEAGWWLRMRELLALSWSELHSITPVERTQDWQIAENTLLVWCQKQAEAELVREVLVQAAKDAKARESALKKIPKKQAIELGRAAGFANRSKALRVAALEGKRDAATGEERAKLDRAINALKRRKVG